MLTKQPGNALRQYKFTLSKSNSIKISKTKGKHVDRSKKKHAEITYHHFCNYKTSVKKLAEFVPLGWQKDTLSTSDTRICLRKNLVSKIIIYYKERKTWTMV